MAFYYFIIHCVSFIMGEINLNLFIGHFYFFFPFENDQFVLSAYLSIGVFAFVLTCCSMFFIKRKLLSFISHKNIHFSLSLTI